MTGIISDIKTAAQIFGEIRRARKEGKEMGVRYSRQIPCISTGSSFLNTVEGCTLSNCGADIFKSARTAFNTLPEEEKHQFEFAPKDGEFIDRVIFWKTLLRLAMPLDQYRIAITAILRWYIHIKRSRKDSTSCDTKGKVTL